VPPQQSPGKKGRPKGAGKGAAKGAARGATGSTEDRQDPGRKANRPPEGPKTWLEIDGPDDVGFFRALHKRAKQAAGCCSTRLALGPLRSALPQARADAERLRAAFEHAGPEGIAAEARTLLAECLVDEGGLDRDLEPPSGVFEVEAESEKPLNNAPSRSAARFRCVCVVDDDISTPIHGPKGLGSGPRAIEVSGPWRERLDDAVANGEEILDAYRWRGGLAAARTVQKRLHTGVNAVKKLDDSAGGGEVQEDLGTEGNADGDESKGSVIARGIQGQVPGRVRGETDGMASASSKVVQDPSRPRFRAECLFPRNGAPPLLVTCRWHASRATAEADERKLLQAFEQGGVQRACNMRADLWGGREADPPRVGPQRSSRALGGQLTSWMMADLGLEDTSTKVRTHACTLLARYLCL
jgi:hypothetical protein